MMFRDEMAASFADGAQMMEEMIKESLAEKTMPPRVIFEWFVKHATYRFVMAEFKFAHGSAEDGDAAKDYAMEVQLLRDICANQGMFGLQTAINDILRQRILHLPPGFEPLLSA